MQCIILQKVIYRGLNKVITVLLAFEKSLISTNKQDKITAALPFISELGKVNYWNYCKEEFIQTVIYKGIVVGVCYRHENNEK
jgi:hypothetical protein